MYVNLCIYAYIYVCFSHAVNRRGSLSVYIADIYGIEVEMNIVSVSASLYISEE